ncbi:hypothetical protein TNIN_448471 [Trichonephila inaurata madagascariensis]|uniref:Maf-like protein n=1 Tax=Trichonephila inaurata madagascariensis TaxID=2747483 RepID=A0A8X6X5B2_9ARAC|nr:hypothetical protein TNIN_448471 [Trichonephila inaurata madagascariensis]
MPQRYCWDDNVLLQAVILAPDEGGAETSWKSAGGTDAVAFICLGGFFHRLNMLEPYAGHRNNLQVILANCSNRFGHLLLDNLGMQYDVMTPDKDEALKIPDYFSPSQYVEEIAKNNARGVAKYHTFSAYEKPLVVIGVDTIVVTDGEIYVKPKDMDEIIALFKKLSGKHHDIFTGVSIIYGIDYYKDPPEYKMRTFFEKTSVKMMELTEEEILDYLSMGESEYRVGGYAIEAQGCSLFEYIDGDYMTAVGLPIHRIAKEFRDLFEANLIPTHNYYE